MWLHCYCCQLLLAVNAQLASAFVSQRYTDQLLPAGFAGLSAKPASLCSVAAVTWLHHVAVNIAQLAPREAG